MPRIPLEARHPAEQAHLGGAVQPRADLQHGVVQLLDDLLVVQLADGEEPRPLDLPVLAGEARPQRAQETLGAVLRLHGLRLAGTHGVALRLLGRRIRGVVRRLDGRVLVLAQEAEMRVVIGEAAVQTSG